MFVLRQAAGRSTETLPDTATSSSKQPAQVDGAPNQEASSLPIIRARHRERIVSVQLRCAVEIKTFVQNCLFSHADRTLAW